MDALSTQLDGVVKRLEAIGKNDPRIQRIRSIPGVLMGLRSEGIVSPLVVDGPINGRVFLAWVQQHLFSELRPKDIVVMDNLSAHKVAGVCEAVEKVGAEVRYLPPYSPDLNPIETLFSKFKSLLRTEAARTVKSLWSTVGRLIDRFAPSECLRYILHAGYKLKS
jgi:transposase